MRLCVGGVTLCRRRRWEAGYERELTSGSASGRKPEPPCCCGGGGWEGGTTPSNCTRCKPSSPHRKLGFPNKQQNKQTRTHLHLPASGLWPQAQPMLLPRKKCPETRIGREEGRLISSGPVCTHSHKAAFAFALHTYMIHAICNVHADIRS